MKDKATDKISILKINRDQTSRQLDFLAVEEPLEIRLAYGAGHHRKQKSISITMRSPGDDKDLAIGFLFTEGIIRSFEQIKNIHHLPCFNQQTKGNIILIELDDNIEINLQKLERHFYTSSSCGVCGKSSIEAIYQSGATNIPNNNIYIDAKLIHQLPDKIRTQQAVFDNTGGLHAAGLFDNNGNLVLIREDVGRHNAVDKLIGAALQEKSIPLHQNILMLSGRVSFELVQKALMAGIPILVAVGAPSTLAIQLAQKSGMTIIAFVRNGKFNIYSGEERVLF
ncbi:MAG TPA: formate dehydrogenase accessory sulfurtransferase FdhD [Saprospiraceae bacterium]|nr:formate dehydrogenase accessory sulfurtransferase FdhD [Saprospiraceae bacterium]